MSYMLSWVRFQALAKTDKWKAKKHRRSNPPKHPRRAMLHIAPQDGVHQKCWQKSKWHPIPDRASTIYVPLRHLWISIQQYSSIFNPCWVLSITAYLCRVLEDKTTRWGGLQGLWEWDPTKPRFCSDESWFHQESRSQSKARWCLEDFLW